MKSKIKSLGAIAALSLLAGQALAAGTPSGTTITNTATLNYSVGGVAQSPVSGTSPSFVVDTKVNLTISPVAGAGSVVNVVSGATRQVIPFTVTNTGNLVNDVLLSGGNLSNGTVYGVYTDNFDGTTCQAYADVNGNGTYESANDTTAYIDELAPDASAKAFMVCDIPASQVNSDFAAAQLTAQAASGGTAGTQGTVLVATAGAKVLGTVAVVFADAAGSDDAASDGKISARSGYLLQTASVSVTKTVAAYCDPVTFSSNPKLVPGAFARYTITVSNAAGAGTSAALGAVTDTLNSRLAIDPNLIAASVSSCSTPTSAAGKGIRVSCAGGTRACVGTPIYLDTATYHSDGTINVNLGTVLPAESGYAAGQIKPGESVSLTFNAVVQ